jgi:hypothetical protein
MKMTEFAVSRFKNRNGVTSWRVSGWLHGLRVRRNFKTREEAAAEKTVFEVKVAQTAAGLRPAATILTEVQLREAELAFQRLGNRSWSLLACLDYVLANRGDPTQQKPVSEAVNAYLGAKAKEQEQTLISARQLRSIRQELMVFTEFIRGVAQRRWWERHDKRVTGHRLVQNVGPILAYAVPAAPYLLLTIGQ